MTTSSSALTRVVDISDMRLLAQRRVPKSIFDYIDGGAEDEQTLRENRRAFDDVSFRPRCAVALPRCDLGTTVLGMPVSFPALLAPVIFDTHFRNAASNNWTFGIQREQGGNNTLVLSYVGSKGTKLFNTYSFNQGATGTAPYNQSVGFSNAKAVTAGFHSIHF